ncbi:hypothetical protein ACVWYH_005770 [Bradyrhizobium sp. GM24.11]
MKGIGPTLNGRNREGDPDYPDGEVWLVRLVRRGEKAGNAAGILSPPVLIQIKDAAFALQSECSCTR